MLSLHFPLATLLYGALVKTALAGSYTLSQSNVGATFLDNFDFQTISDPTSGRVEYVSQSTAEADDLVYTDDDTFIMRADNTTVLDASSSTGRKSIRIQSKTQYTTHVAIFNIRHMPQGCGTWPALWETDSSVGTANGEVDILEGVNDVPPNSVTLHTVGNCTMPTTRTELGTATSFNCSSSTTDSRGNNGCTVDAPYTASYGPVFNTYGGGYYALERNSELIRVWFWSRNDTGIPSDISGTPTTIDTDNWGTPIAAFPNTTCDFDTIFKANNIIINLTFCGTWAGTQFIANENCPGTCVDYVNNNPSAFTDAYWDFAGAHIYES